MINWRKVASNTTLIQKLKCAVKEIGKKLYMKVVIPGRIDYIV